MQTVAAMEFLNLLTSLEVVTDPDTASRAFHQILSLAQARII